MWRRSRPDPEGQPLPDGVAQAWADADRVLSGASPLDGSHEQYAQMSPQCRAVVIDYCERMWAAGNEGERSRT